MGFQRAVYRYSGAGIPGEQYNDSPTRIQPLLLNSSDPTKNTFGSAMFTLNPAGAAGATGSAQAGNPDGTGVFAGLMVNPKAHALYSSTLQPSLTLPNGEVAEFATMGSFIVSLPAAANVGDKVIFDNTTGAISTIAPGAALPTGKTAGHAYVDFFSVTAASLGVITLTYVPSDPVPASVGTGYVTPEGDNYVDEAGDQYVAPETNDASDEADPLLTAPVKKSKGGK